MNLHLCDDLMFIAQVSSWAKSHSVKYRNVKSPQHLAAVFAEVDPTRVIVDLQFSGLDIGQLAKQVREQAPGSSLIGYAQHVMTGLIAEAKQAGFDVVYTRGQFDRGYPQLLSP